MTDKNIFVSKSWQAMGQTESLKKKRETVPLWFTGNTDSKQQNL